MSFISANTATPNDECPPTKLWRSHFQTTSVDRITDQTSSFGGNIWSRDPHGSFGTPTCHSGYQDAQLNGSILPQTPESDDDISWCNKSVDPDGTGLHFLSSCKSARPTGTRYTRSTMTKSSVAKYRPNRDKTMTQQARDKKRARDRKYTRERKEREGAKLNSLHETIAKLEQEKEESELVISSMSAEKGRMSSKIDQSSELVDNLMTIISDMSSRCNTLQAENDSLRNAIKFYGPKCSHFIHQMSNLSNGFAGAIQMNDQYNASRIRELEQQLSFGCDTPSFSLDTNQVEQVPKQESMDDRTWLSGT